MKNKFDIHRQVECQKCYRMVEMLELFPDDLCIDCHSKEFEKQEHKATDIKNLLIKSIKL